MILALLWAGLTGVARGQVITEFPTSGSPYGITAGPDGNLWFTEYLDHKIGRITTAGTVTEFPVPDSSPAGIVTGPDGNLWFTDAGGNSIGRITTAGVVTGFPIPTADSRPAGIAVGPDGNLWFTEEFANQIGRITVAGVVTEFPIPTAGSAPRDITSGPDGNLWFTESAVLAHKIGRMTTTGAVTEFTTTGNSSGITAGPDGKLWFTDPSGNSIGRITIAGVVTEFSIPTSATEPWDITAGPDGNLWFTESFPNGNQIGRITPAGAITEFPVPTNDGEPYGIAAGSDGNLWFAEFGFPQGRGNKIGQITTGSITPHSMAVDAQAAEGSLSNLNGVLEPGERVQVAPSWKNTLAAPLSFTGAASNLTGPVGPTYRIYDASGDYGTVGADAISNCNSATGDCYVMSVSGTRPAAHWDATFTESLSSSSVTRHWTLHAGKSFPDVPTSNQFYAFVENLFHNGVTGGCGGGNYCPAGSVTRAQMAVFLLKGKLGAAQLPPAATGAVFNDVQAGDFAAGWIEQLAGFQITGGCGGGNYCPNSPVTRAQMAVFLLKSEHGSAYAPPHCTGIFTDVACPSPFADWIERLFHEGISGGCGNNIYCPNSPNTRGQMAAFLVKTFKLQLYGP